MTIATVTQLFTHPIKGLTPQACSQVILTEGHGIKGDRAFALMFEDSIKAGEPLQSEAVPWMSKKHFAVQNDWPRLAALDCKYESETGVLRVKCQGTMVLEVGTKTARDREQISSFFTDYLATCEPTKEARHPQQMPLFFVGNANGETRYPDREPVHISLLSQGTLDRLTEVAGQQVDVRRFRPNIVLTGIEAWEEFNWIGQEFQLGSARIVVTAKIGRCANIEVNPETGDRDLPLFALLQEHWGHAQTGVLAKIMTTGEVAVGDRLQSLAV